MNMLTDVNNNNSNKINRSSSISSNEKRDSGV